MLEELKAIILGPTPSAATENIYQKRHIAAGIPSIYGNYSEPKFDALGLSFRVENLVGRLLEDLVAEGIEPYVTRDSLRRMAIAIGRFERALAVDGVDSRALERQPRACSRRASAATTSPSTSTRTCSSSWSTA